MFRAHASTLLRGVDTPPAVPYVANRPKQLTGRQLAGGRIEREGRTQMGQSSPERRSQERGEAVEGRARTGHEVRLGSDPRTGRPRRTVQRSTWLGASSTGSVRRVGERSPRGSSEAGSPVAREHPGCRAGKLASPSGCLGHLIWGDPGATSSRSNNRFAGYRARRGGRVFSFFLSARTARAGEGFSVLTWNP